MSKNLRSKNIEYEKTYRFPSVTLTQAKKLIEEKKMNVNQITSFKVIPNCRARFTLEYRTTLLYAAVTNNDKELVDYLLSKNADPNLVIKKYNSNCYVLDKAVLNRNIIIVKKLINHGAKLDHNHTLHFSPLHNAVNIKNSEMIKCLINSGADIKNVFKNTNLLCPTNWLPYRNCHEIIQLLWKSGADFCHCKTPGGLYAAMLSEVIQDGRPRTQEIKNLLDLGAEYSYVDQQTGKKFYLLHETVQIQALESLMMLLEHKRCDQTYVDTAVTDSKYSLLHAAAYPGLFVYRRKVSANKLVHLQHRDINKELVHILNAGVDVNILDANGKLAINYVSIKKFKAILKIKEHIVKLIAVGRYVCQRNAEAVKGPEFEDLRNECQEEVVKMKALIGNSNVSYCRFLRLSIHRNAGFLKNVDLSKIIDNNFCNKPEGTLCEMFPLYGGLIYYRLLRVRGRIEMLKKVGEVIENIFLRILPYDYCQEIYYYLTIEDLEKLSEVF